MSVTTKQTHAVFCTECSGATKETPRVVFVHDDWKVADEQRGAHADFHRHRDRVTDDALRKAKFSRLAIAKMRNADSCQCFCPQVGDHTCDEKSRDVVVHFPYWLMGQYAKASVMCGNCAGAWESRFEATTCATTDRADYREVVKYFERGGQKHLAVFDMATGEQVESVGSDRSAEEVESSSGGGGDDGTVHLGAPVAGSSESEQADLRTGLGNGDGAS